jgi:hypothetical protein
MNQQHGSEIVLLNHYRVRKEWIYLIPVTQPSDIHPVFRDTPINSLLAYYNFNLPQSTLGAVSEPRIDAMSLT